MKFILYKSLPFCIIFILFQCIDPKQSKEQFQNENIPPNDLYLLDKIGEPTKEFLALRESEIEHYKKTQTLYRNAPNNIPGQWTVQGPGNLGGRVNAIAVNPQDEKILFIGFSHGGAYRTLDGGQNWTPVFDNESTLYISDIAIDPIHPNTIYIATGDLNGGFYCGQGNGIYKSTDNGNTWKHLGLSETRVLSEILIDFKNPQIIYAASLGYSYEKNKFRGLYKSIDGGLNWNQVFYINDSTGITDIAMHPVNQNILFAVSWNKLGLNNRGVVNGPDGQIFKSIDGGANWKKLKKGLPSDSINGRIAIAISQSEPNVIYARYVRSYDCNGDASNNLYAIYKSTDTGESWNELPALEAGSGLDCSCLGGFGWYFNSIAVNPDNADDVYILGVEMFRSQDGGYNWNLAVPKWFTYDVHADKHKLVFLKNGDFLLGTDGGLYKHHESSDTWEDLENIPTNQVYRVAYNPNEPKLYYGGLQDNGSTGGNKLFINNWDRIYGGDGFQMAFKKDNPNIYYAEYQYGEIRQYNNGMWQNFTGGLNGNKNWDFPYMISRHNSSKLLAGSNQVYYNASDTGANWKAISPNLVGNPRYAARSNPSITTIDESPLDSSILIAGTINGNVWITKNFDKNWMNVSSNLPSAYISSVKTSYKDRNTFYATLSGHRGNDFNAYVYKTIDNGNSWQNIHGDLPGLPVYDILVYPGKGDSVLFVGNHIGVYVTLDGGLSWSRVGDNMPFIEVFDLEINESEKTLIAATVGKSIMTFPLEDVFKKIVRTTNQNIAAPISIFPNPVVSHLTISGIEKMNSRIECQIVDELGKVLIHSVEINRIEPSVNVSDLPNGLYYLNLKFNSAYKSIPFLKQ
jgi:photosystem II stability/assembly factor-like uncharacterized protein